MADLFSPLVITGKELPNRIVMAPVPSGYANADGFVPDELVAHYKRLAAGGVGLIISEPILIARAADGPAVNHLGLYHDAFIPGLRRLSNSIRPYHGRLLLSLEAPPELDPLSVNPVLVCRQFLFAAWRALAAGADGIMLSSADGGILHQLLSPLTNQRGDQYGLVLSGRIRLALEIIDAIRT
ncbi:MAG: NADH:flavin oxidoreductase, partial [Oscillochloris sp.]|nr:NADH:flavin oxidoreductase [Oscillochloris sp.]